MSGLQTGKEGVLRGLQPAPQSYNVYVPEGPSMDDYASMFTAPMDAQREQELHELQMKSDELQLDLIEMEAEQMDQENKARKSQIKALKKMMADPAKKMLLEQGMASEQMPADQSYVDHPVDALGQQPSGWPAMTTVGGKPVPESVLRVPAEGDPRIVTPSLDAQPSKAHPQMGQIPAESAVPRSRAEALLADPAFQASVRSGSQKAIDRYNKALEADFDDAAEAAKPMTAEEILQKKLDQQKLDLLARELGYKEDLLLQKMNKPAFNPDTDLSVYEVDGTKFLFDKDGDKVGWVEAPEADKYQMERVSGDTTNGVYRLGNDLFVFKDGVPYKPESTVRHLSKGGKDDDDDTWDYEDDDPPSGLNPDDHAGWEAASPSVRKTLFPAPVGKGSGTSSVTSTGPSAGTRRIKVDTSFNITE